MTRRLPQGEFPGSSRDRKVRKGGGRLPGKEVGRAQLKSKKEEIPELDVRVLSAWSYPDPIRCWTRSGYPGNRCRCLSRNRERRDLRGLFTSIMESSSKGLLTQVTQFWNLLDDLAESNPEGYEKFIQQQLKEGEQLCAAPEPWLCLQTRILFLWQWQLYIEGKSVAWRKSDSHGERLVKLVSPGGSVNEDIRVAFGDAKPKEKILFINLCQWKRIPAPQSNTHPVPLSIGRPEDRSETSVIDVAYNPDVLQAAEKDQVKKDQLIQMKMKKELTLEQISSTVSNPDDFQLLLPKDEVSSKTRCLIEEISSTESQVEMKEPAYELKIVADQNEKPLKIEIKVELPGINSASLCDLSVSEDDLLIEVPEKYRLYLNLPESVDTEMTTAKFIKEKATLIIIMPLV
ncbi:PIH1 domain-containing protein 2 isoform X2 [Prionailurus iriomotensis]